LYASKDSGQAEAGEAPTHERNGGEAASEQASPLNPSARRPPNNGR